MFIVTALFLCLAVLAMAFPKAMHVLLIAVFVASIAAAVLFFGIGLVIRA